MRVIVAWIVGLGLMANGLTMLAIPDAWYAFVPGVPELARLTRISCATSAPPTLWPEPRLCGSRSIAPRARPRLPARTGPPVGHRGWTRTCPSAVR